MMITLAFAYNGVIFPVYLLGGGGGGADPWGISGPGMGAYILCYHRRHVSRFHTVGRGKLRYEAGIKHRNASRISSVGCSLPSALSPKPGESSLESEYYCCVGM